jgi:hypothetical protein
LRLLKKACHRRRLAKGFIKEDNEVLEEINQLKKNIWMI